MSCNELCIDGNIISFARLSMKNEASSHPHRHVACRLSLSVKYVNGPTFPLL